MAPIISKIYIYPIKSCKALELTQTQLSKYGLAHDRVFMVVNPETAKLRTSREFHQMVLAEQTIVDDTLVITAGGKTIKVPLVPSPSVYPESDVYMFRHLMKALDLGEEAAQFFTEYLGAPSRLVYKSPNQVRAVTLHTPTASEMGYQAETAFADCYPVLALSEESVAEINTKLEKPVQALNFRPNLLIRGVTAPWEEDTWCVVKISGVVYYFTCRCTRCDSPNVDPNTGIKDKLQPQKTIQAFRRIDKGKKAKFFGCVGMNVVPSAVEGTLRVGDVLEIEQVFQGERMHSGSPGFATSQEQQEALDLQVAA
ncbi:hypothetical protein BGZ93_003602 [Podila epicladia]|nr:hypothetical protein BGZ92_009406 [Podila epicladia]KAG0100786.1 hypothetical protein BGZ93_003602 [Podila epicladia]